MGNGWGSGHSGAEGGSVRQSYGKRNKVLRADTHSLSLGALFTFEASDARLTLHERKKRAHTGFSPKSLLTPPHPTTSCSDWGAQKRGARW